MMIDPITFLLLVLVCVPFVVGFVLGAIFGYNYRKGK